MRTLVTRVPACEHVPLCAAPCLPGQGIKASLGFGTFMVSSGGGKTLGTLGNIYLIEKIQPDILIGMPTFVYHPLREAVEMGKHLAKS